MMMNRSSFYRLIKPPMGAFHWRQYYQPSPSIKSGLKYTTPEPFTLIDNNIEPNVSLGWRNPETCCEILGSGMILLRKYINLQGQADIVNKCQELGVGVGGFYVPRNRSGDALRLHMTCFGHNWDPVTKYKNSYRSDGSAPPKVPWEFVVLANLVIKDAKSHIEDLPSMVPDVCVVNSYNYDGRLGLHQDRDESPESLERGLPVVSVSIGDTAEFWYGHTRDEKKLEMVYLKSGDVLIFGGKSRLIYHGVKTVYGKSCPLRVTVATKLLQPGRLNLTLRQM